MRNSMQNIEMIASIHYLDNRLKLKSWDQNWTQRLLKYCKRTAISAELKYFID